MGEMIRDRFNLVDHIRGSNWVVLGDLRKNIVKLRKSNPAVADLHARR
jgi:hypothetical protein